MTLPDRVAAYEATDELMRGSLEHYCAKLVKIATKNPGEVVPFTWNEAQRRLHKRLEKQIDARGLVRAIVLKGRQMGVSTYVAARFFHKSTLNLGRNTFILTHEDKATKQLFGMVARMHAHMPDDYRPETVKANENELAFDGYEASYRIGTAKNVGGTGRSLTLQLFHGSEVAYWPHAEGHFGGVMQAVGLVDNTEIILESTANGIGGTFYEQWSIAEKGQSDFIPIFLPWMIEPGYARPLQLDYEPSLEEETYQRLYKLTDEQVCWMHFKNIELGGKPGIIAGEFKKEYPATAAEAFQASSGASLIGDEYINAARRHRAHSQTMLPRVLGIDVARSLKDVRDKNGKKLQRDSTRIVDRQGRKMGIGIDEAHWSDDPVFLSSRVMYHLRENPNIRKAFIDVTEGMGAAIASICKGNGFEERVAGVNFGSQAQEPLLYPNRRCEMAARMRDWFKDAGGAQIPDDDLAHKHLASVNYKHDANSRLVLEPKDKIKARLGFSPDWFDAGALTFAEILPIEEPDERPKWMREHVADDSGGDFMTS